MGRDIGNLSNIFVENYLKLPKENVWFCDTDGLGTPGYGLCMSAEDMAKIGLLCLNKGRFNNKQIISPIH